MQYSFVIVLVICNLPAHKVTFTRDTGALNAVVDRSALAALDGHIEGLSDSLRWKSLRAGQDELYSLVWLLLDGDWNYSECCRVG